MHIFSTLFTASYVVDKLIDEENVASAIKWCRETNISRVYIEVYRDRKFAEVSLLSLLKNRFTAAGFDIRGCVTTTGLGKRSTGWEVASCFTARETLDELKSVFERAATVFDIIMIDDFLFTDCACSECEKARGSLSWPEYRSKIMLDAASERILNPARAINPNVKIILKYPNWYEEYFERGYDTVKETEIFDLIWVGNETREPDSAEWGRYPQYLAFYIQTLLTEAGGEKCGGGWYDSLSTKPETYLEQARQTILGRARESMLFCYDILTKDKLGIDDTTALRSEMSGLLKLDSLISDYTLTGVEAPQRQNAIVTGTERNFYPFCGMLGIPVIGKVGLNDNARSEVLGIQAAGFPGICEHIGMLFQNKTPLLLSSGLLAEIGDGPLPAALKDAWKNSDKNGTYLQFVNDHTAILHVSGDLWNLLKLPQSELEALRNMLLSPFGISVSAPTNVSLHLYKKDGYLRTVIENFSNTAADIRLNTEKKPGKALLSLPDNSNGLVSDIDGSSAFMLAPRSLIVL